MLFELRDFKRESIFNHFSEIELKIELSFADSIKCFNANFFLQNNDVMIHSTTADVAI